MSATWSPAYDHSDGEWHLLDDESGEYLGSMHEDGSMAPSVTTMLTRADIIAGLAVYEAWLEAGPSSPVAEHRAPPNPHAQAMLKAMDDAFRKQSEAMSTTADDVAAALGAFTLAGKRAAHVAHEVVAPTSEPTVWIVDGDTAQGDHVQMRWRPPPGFPYFNTRDCVLLLNGEPVHSCRTVEPKQGDGRSWRGMPRPFEATNGEHTIRLTDEGATFDGHAVVPRS